jgi:hypothetical protein
MLEERVEATTTTVAQNVKMTVMEVAAITVATVIALKMIVVEGDGPTINAGGFTSWAAVQPPRLAFYGRAIALWP